MKDTYSIGAVSLRPPDGAGVVCCLIWCCWLVVRFGCRCHSHGLVMLRDLLLVLLLDHGEVGLMNLLVIVRGPRSLYQDRVGKLLT